MKGLNSSSLSKVFGGGIKRTSKYGRSNAAKKKVAERKMIAKAVSRAKSNLCSGMPKGSKVSGSATIGNGTVSRTYAFNDDC